MRGAQKPWANARNHEVIARVERGETLPQPPDCPDALYAALQALWASDERERWSVERAHAFLGEMLAKEEEHQWLCVATTREQCASPSTMCSKGGEEDRGGEKWNPVIS